MTDQLADSDLTAPADQPPETAAKSQSRLDGGYIASIVITHLLAIGVLVPWLFSWTGVVLCVLGVYVFGTLGINVGFHRLLTHRGFTCPRWLEYTLAIIGTCSMQDSPARWVAIHRRHHQYADDELDPHSPIAGFFWAHVGWVMEKSEDMHRKHITARYARDMMRQPFYAWFEYRFNWAKVAILSWALYFIAGFSIVALSGGAWSDAVQFGLSLWVWGAVLRTVFVWHITWLVNSVTHIWGYRNYATPDHSRNNAIIAWLSAGEGWHNNHHADPRSARHGHKSGEFDLSWMAIRLLMLLGLAKDVALPSPILAKKFNDATAKAGTDAATGSNAPPTGSKSGPA